MTSLNTLVQLEPVPFSSREDHTLPLDIQLGDTDSVYSSNSSYGGGNDAMGISPGLDLLDWTVSISELPLELLAYIFETSHQPPDKFGRFVSPLTLSHVCSVWRSTALQISSLWTTIDMEHNTELVMVYLKRSGHSRLNLRIAFDCFYVDRWEGRARVQALCRLLKPHRHRLRNISFHPYYAMWVEASLDLIGDADNQVVDIDLFELRFPPFAPEEAWEGVDPGAVCQQINCRPKRLHTEGFPWGNPKLFTNSLRSICLSWISSEFGINLHDLLAHLASCSNLQYLECTGAFAPS